jgi:large subunit ribosomal protein L17
MATQGRKNVHGKAGVRFKAPYTTSKHKSMLRNVITELIMFGHVTVTKATAKDVRIKADKLVTLAKRVNTDPTLFGDGTIKSHLPGENLHALRQIASYVRPRKPNTKSDTHDAIYILTREIAPKFANRVGGYTSGIKVGPRRGDNAEMVLVTWCSEEVETHAQKIAKRDKFYRDHPEKVENKGERK